MYPVEQSSYCNDRMTLQVTQAQESLSAHQKMYTQATHRPDARGTVAVFATGYEETFFLRFSCPRITAFRDNPLVFGKLGKSLKILDKI
jgi:hypothetical protein